MAVEPPGVDMEQNYVTVTLCITFAIVKQINAVCS